MDFQFDPSIKRVGSYDTQNRSRVGFSQGGVFVRHPFHVGGYSFSNPISATIWAYLFRHDTPAGATAGVEAIEKLLDPPGVMKQLVTLVANNLKDKAVEYIFPPAAIMNKINSAVGAAGGLYFDLKIQTNSNTAMWNDYPPSNDATNYAKYAVAYWKATHQGPAYKLSRDTVRPNN